MRINEVIHSNWWIWDLILLQHDHFVQKYPKLCQTYSTSRSYFQGESICSLYSYYFQSLQRLSTKVCKYFRPKSLVITLHTLVWFWTTAQNQKIFSTLLMSSPALSNRFANCELHIMSHDSGPTKSKRKINIEIC